jgi:dihydroorotate dehydrogenase electron transfer subunit
MSCSYQYETAPVVENRETLPGYRRIAVRAPRIAAAARPGQFVMLRGWEDQRDPILPRPFDIAAADPAAGTVMVIGKTAGRGTRLLADYAPGTSLLTAGPLGKGSRNRIRTPLACSSAESDPRPSPSSPGGPRPPGGRVIAVLSASTSSRLVGKEELERVRGRTAYRHGRRLRGFHGNGTELLDSIMRGTALSAVYTCGSNALPGMSVPLTRRADARASSSWRGIWPAAAANVMAARSAEGTTQATPSSAATARCFTYRRLR